MSKRRNHEAGFKVREALEALKGELTVSELAVEYGVHPTMINQWKKALLEGALDIFERGSKEKPKSMRDRSRNYTQRLGTGRHLWFFPENSSPGPASEARDDRTQPRKAVDWGIVPSAFDLWVLAQLRTARRDRYEPSADFPDR